MSGTESDAQTKELRAIMSQIRGSNILFRLIHGKTEAG